MSGEKPAWEQLGEAFVKQYYGLFDSGQKGNMISLYHPTAMLTYEENKCQGHEGIQNILMNKVTFQKIEHAITKLDCQPFPDGGVVVMVCGLLKADEDQPMGYCETFVIRPDNNNYYIFHQMFRLALHNI